MTAAARAAAAVLLTLLVGVLGVPAAAAPAAPVPAQDAVTTPRFVQLSVSSVQPPTVTASTTEVTVTGSLRNTGDRDVRDLEVRLQRAPAVATAAALRTALRTTPEDFDAIGPFTEAAPLLSPGQSVDFTLTLPVTGGGSTLALDAPGVYPVLVNVNGEPDFGSTARLDAAHFLLPVQSVTTRPGSTPAAPGPVPAVTVLWPLADRPRLLPVDPGQTPLLSDDDLAASFAPGGRLDGLLASAADATQASTDPGGQLRSSLCLAVDPDLLVTAEAMTAAGGYRVSTSAGSTAGTGTQDAARWLNRLRSVAASTCVTALPWAQADLNAAARAGLDEQESIAVGDGAREVARVTGTTVVPGVTWPTGGALSDAAAARLAAMGQTGLLLSADAVGGPDGSELDVPARAVRTTVGSTSLSTVLLDPAVATALAATGAGPTAEATAGEGVSTGLDDGSTAPGRELALQDALGALSWPSLVGAGSAEEPTGAPGSLVVAPPQVWTADATEAAAVLGTVRGLLTDGRATAQPLATAVRAAAASTTTASLAYPVDASAAELPSTATAAVAAADDALDAFGSATRTDVQTQVDPATLVRPLAQDLVRSLSSAEGPPPAEGVTDVLTRLFARVSLQTPGGTYTLASEQSPLLLVVRNDLPVAVDVHVSVTGPPGLKVTDIGVQQLPANGARQLMLPTSVGRTGQFAVDVSLTTAGGQSLGPATRVLVRSTAYGTATAAVTGAAALLLLLLVARRLWHRFRGQPDPADEGREVL